MVRADRLSRALGCAPKDLAVHFHRPPSTTIKAHDMLTPVNKTWAMGFSWSSFVAQSKLLSIARDAGLREEQILSLESPPPAGASEMVTIATDDAVFVHTDAEIALQRLISFDRALDNAGVIKHPAKDEDAALETVALGCHLGNSPPWVEPDLSKLLALLLGITAFADARVTTPRIVGALLGSAGWFAQLTQWHYSIFVRAYDLSGVSDLDSAIEVTREAQDEFAVYAALAPLLVADLERPFLPLLACSDASPSFGYGVSVRSIDADMAETLSARSEQRGDYLTFDDVMPDNGGQRKMGTPIELPFSMESFTDVLSIRASSIAHSGCMEAHAVLLMVQWILRSASRLSSRVVVGIDATTVLAVMLKGRTSAPSLRKAVRAVAAHCLGGNLLLLPLWVPSRYNPAAKPSRGVRRRPVRRRIAKPPRLSKTECKLAARLRELEHFRRSSPYADFLSGSEVSSSSATLSTCC